MDLIYVILSIYLRLFQTALPFSRSTTGAVKRRPEHGRPLAMWIPVVGWVSVMVRFVPQARWLTWRVTSVQRLSEAPPSSQRPRWKQTPRSDQEGPTQDPPSTDSKRSD